ncbi:hypothetical protein H0H92_010737, partial [Tricholoma furcatifolium]
MAAAKPSSTPVPRNLRARPPPLPPPAPKPRRSSKQVQEDIAAKNKAKQDRIQAVNDMVDNVAHLETGMKEKEQDEMVNAHHPPVSMQKKIPRLQTAPTNDPEPPMDPEPLRDPPMDPENISAESSPMDEQDTYSPSASNADEDSDSMENAAPAPAPKPRFRDRVNATRREQGDGNEEERDGHKRKLSTGLA